MKKLFFIAVVLIAVVIGNIFFWNFSYSRDVLNNYNLGLQKGMTTGYQEGYTDGYYNGSKTGYAQGNSSGFSTGYIQGLKDGAGTGYNIRDPSHQEMLSFLATDTVHNHPYVNGSYTCFNFANDFGNEAFNQGYRCGVVYLSLDNNKSVHSLNCFKTTDSGLFFIEPQVNEVVSLVAGQIYQFEGYQPMGTVDYYTIVW